MLEQGEIAPDFEALDQQGTRVRLSDFKGKRVVLYFYPKDHTSGCTAQACNLRDHYEALEAADYVILGISTDSVKSHESFASKQKLPFTLLSDPDKVIHERYGTWVEKSMYGRSYMGTARVTYIIGAEGKIEQRIDKVKTKDHANQVLSSLGG